MRWSNGYSKANKEFFACSRATHSAMPRQNLSVPVGIGTDLPNRVNAVGGREPMLRNTCRQWVCAMVQRSCGGHHERLVIASLLAPEFDEKIVAGRIFWVQHRRPQRIKMVKILRSGTDAVLWHQKNLSCVWISYRGSRGKAAHVNVTSLGQVRTCDHALLPCDGNSIRHVSFRFFRRNSRSAQHSDRRRKLHFLNYVWYLFDRCRRPPGNV